DALHDRLIFFQPEPLHHRVRSFADETAQWHLQFRDRRRGFCRGEFARRGSDRPSRIIEGDISRQLAERFHYSHAVLRVPHLHPDMKTLNWHRHGSICTSPANSAMYQRPSASNHSRFAANGARPAWTWLTPDI